MLFGFGFLNIFLNTSAFLKGRFKWTCWSDSFLVPRCLLCAFAIPGAGIAKLRSACSVPPPSVSIGSHMTAVVSSARVHMSLHCCRNGDTCQHLCQHSSGASPALEIRVNCLWATCSWVASGEGGPFAAIHFCTALLILVEAFLWKSCVNSSTFQLLDVESENFQVLLAFFA